MCTLCEEKIESDSVCDWVSSQSEKGQKDRVGECL